MKVLYNRITRKISQNSFLLDYVILRLPKNQIVTSIHALAFCHALPLFAHEILMQCMCTRCSLKGCCCFGRLAWERRLSVLFAACCVL